MKISNSLLITGLMLLGLGSGQAVADIYKVTQEDGSIVYSDKPATDPNATTEIVNIPNNSVQSYPSNIANSNVKSNASNRDSSKDVNLETLRQVMPNISQQDAIHYNIRIDTPSDESAYRRPAQTIDVSVNVTPSLSPNDQVIIQIDGKDYAVGTTASIPTIDLLPGDHTLTARIMSATATSQPQSIKFYIIQNTVAVQNKIKLVNQLKAYYQLPWYKRMMIQLRKNKPSAKNVRTNTPTVSTAFE